MQKILFTFFLILIGCSLISKKNDITERSPAQEYGNKGQQIAFPQDQYLNFKSLKEFLISERIKSIEEALPTLSAKYSEYFKFHTLMYNSLSRHESSFEEPRVLIFGPDARFILTFNGNNHQRNGNSFETVEYSSQSHSFLFREIAFKSEGFNSNTVGLEPDEIAFQNENILISNPNPAKCLQCHANASPIWATYFLWPGAYGSDDDQLHMSFDRASWNANNRSFMQASDRPQSQGRLMVFKPGLADKELEGIVRYLNSKPTHPRYKWLPEQIMDQGVLRYANGEAFSALDFSNQFDTERKRLNVGYDWPSRPNLFFQEVLMKLNQDRLIARLEGVGLKGAFNNPAWKTLSATSKYLKSENPIKDLALIIQTTISQFKLKGTAPTAAQIETLLKQNLKDEIQMQRHKVAVQQSAFGPDSLRLLPPKYPCSRFVYCWMKDPTDFYSKLLELKQVFEVDKIAFTIEGDDQVLLTMLAILLNDQGIDLHNYNMNHAQLSLSFYEGGLSQVIKYLGLDANIY